MSNLKVHLVYNGEPCLVLSLSNMVKHDFGKVWQEPSRFVKDGHDMSWHCQVLSCHVMTLWMTCHGNVMTKNLVMVFVMVTKCSVTFCHILSSWQKKNAWQDQKTLSAHWPENRKKGRVWTTLVRLFLSWSKRPFFCHGLSRWQTMTTLWQTVTNRDKPWQTVTNHDKTMTNRDKPWQYYDKPWQSLTIPGQT